MSMIFQSYAIWPNMTVARERRLRPARCASCRAAEIDRRVDADPRRRADGRTCSDRYPAELSGGQQQRVALARAIVVAARGAAARRAAVATSTPTCARRCASRSAACTTSSSITTVYVTHDQAEAMVTSDRIAVMNQGRIEQVDAPRALYARPQTPLRRGLHRPHQLAGRARCAASDVVFDGFAIARARASRSRPPSRAG